MKLRSDFLAGTAVFLVALPLCLGIALASNAPIAAGLLGGIVGGIVVGFLSGSQTSVSGPAAGLTAIVAQKIMELGSFEAFLTALFLAGLIQVALGSLRVGFVASYFPSSVINGLLAAIGIILILKQLPHLIGFDDDYVGEMAFHQIDDDNTLTAMVHALSNLHLGALFIGLSSLFILYVWDKIDRFKRSVFPSSLFIVAFGIGVTVLLQAFKSQFAIDAEHLVQVPVTDGATGLLNLLKFPKIDAFWDARTYMAAGTIAVVASLETLLNLEAVDKLDSEKRTSPPNRELAAQGVANSLLGLVGGIPVTSVIIRSSVNLNAGAKSKLSAIIHGVLILICLIAIPNALNFIPLSCLAAVLIMTGVKLCSVEKFKKLWSRGLHQFLPFLITIIAIVFSDLLTGVLIGLGTSILFIIHSHLVHPLGIIREKHLNQSLSRIVFGHQVSFLNRQALTKAFEAAEPGTHLVLDASQVAYIDRDILDLMSEFREKALQKKIVLSFVGFKEAFQMPNEVNYQEHLSHDVRNEIGPAQFLQMLKEGNKRVCSGKRLQRDLNRQIMATSAGQYPLGVVLSCMDSRTPVEFAFDLGIGEIFSIRMAGNVTSEKVLGSLEYACSVAGSKLIVVMGHTRCGAISAATDLLLSSWSAKEKTGCDNLDSIVSDIQSCIDAKTLQLLKDGKVPREQIEDYIAQRNVDLSIDHILKQSPTLAKLTRIGQIGIVGCLYDIRTGKASFFDEEGANAEVVEETLFNPEAEAVPC